MWVPVLLVVEAYVGGEVGIADGERSAEGHAVTLGICENKGIGFRVDTLFSVAVVVHVVVASEVADGQNDYMSVKFM